jgi:hypothetical protein
MYNGQSSWGGSDSGICWLERWTDVSDKLWFEFHATSYVMVLVFGQSECVQCLLDLWVPNQNSTRLSVSSCRERSVLLPNVDGANPHNGSCRAAARQTSVFRILPQTRNHLALAPPNSPRANMELTSRPESPTKATVRSEPN